jgi:hypothetical protein
MRVDDSTGKCAAPGTDKFSSVVERKNMELGSRFICSLRIKTQTIDLMCDDVCPLASILQGSCPACFRCVRCWCHVAIFAIRYV